MGILSGALLLGAALSGCSLPFTGGGGGSASGSAPALKVHVAPESALTLATQVDVGLLTAALAGLGLGVNIRHIVALGWRPMALGVGAWSAAAVTALIGCAVLAR